MRVVSAEVSVSSRLLDGGVASLRPVGLHSGFFLLLDRLLTVVT